MRDDQIRPRSKYDAEGAATRRRGRQLEDAILDAAWGVLVEGGFRDFTFEAVAARAGTSRPVLYRRWPQRDVLLLAVVRRFCRSQPIEVPDTGGLREDAIGFLLNAEVGRTRMVTLMGIGLADFLRDAGTDLAELRASLHAPGEPPPCETIVQRAVRRGEVPDVPRSPRVLSLPLDLFRHEAIMTKRAVPVEVVHAIVDEVWMPVLKNPHPLRPR